MKRWFWWAQSTAILLLVLSTAAPAGAVTTDPAYQTGFKLWRGADGGFINWSLAGTRLSNNLLMLDPASAQAGQDPYPAGGYNGKNFYNGGSFVVGEATSPELPVSFDFQEAIASWNAETPDGSWIETQVRARLGGRWTKWYNLGVWASGTATVERHSVNLQSDADGTVSVDTLVLAKSKVPADALQLKVRLFSTGSMTPLVRSMSLTFSSTPAKKITPSAGNPALWGSHLLAPPCSQMVYPDGGNVWCSPTSTSMVLGFWGIDPGPCEPRVRAAVVGTYDWRYDGNGNWPFNTAYAASRGMEGYVARFTSLAALEPWLSQGVPVVMSIAWGKKDLTNAPIPSSDGHLIVLTGFDASGNALVNDPAAAPDSEVPRTYLRSELESVWLTNSGGTVYLIFPPGWNTPGL